LTRDKTTWFGVNFKKTFKSIKINKQKTILTPPKATSQSKNTSLNQNIKAVQGNLQAK